MNWIKFINSADWNGTIKLLAECWSGSTYEETPRHLFVINLNNLPEVDVEKVKVKSK